MSGASGADASSHVLLSLKSVIEEVISLLCVTLFAIVDNERIECPHSNYRRGA